MRSLLPGGRAYLQGIGARVRDNNGRSVHKQHELDMSRSGDNADSGRSTKMSPLTAA